jgi:zinc protease
MRTVADYREALTESLYHRMLNNRLYELTQKPDTPFLDAYSGQGRMVRTEEFYILGADVKEGQVEEGLEALLIEAKRVRDFGFTPSELDRAKEEMLRMIERYYNERDKTRSRSYVREYRGHFLEGEVIPGIEYEFELYQRLIPPITADRVNSLAGKWLGEDNRVILVDGPEKATVVFPKEEELLAIFDRVEAVTVTAYEDAVSDEPLLSSIPAAGRVVSENRREALGVTEWTLSNGVRVVLKPTDFKNDQILFTSYSPGGTSLVSDDLFIAADTAADAVVAGGAGAFSQVELSKKLAGVTVSVSPFIRELTEGMLGSSTPKDLETMFQLLYLYFTAPRKDADAFKTLKEQLRASVENRLSSPEQTFWDEVRSAIRDDHFRARPLTVDSLDRMDLEASFRIYKDRFADAGDFTFFFVGNFELEGIKPLIETYLGGLPSQKRKESWRDLGIDPPEGIVERVVKKGIEEKSQVQFAFNGTFRWNLEELIKLTALAEVLDIRLRDSIREEVGGTYSIGVFDSPSHYPDEEYYLFIGFGCAPDQAETLSARVLDEIEELLQNGPDVANVSKVKEILKRERETNLQNNNFWLNVLRSYYLNGTDPGLILKYAEIVDSITASDVHSAARRYLNRNRYVRVVLYPEGWTN